MAVQPIPEGAQRLTPYLVVDGAADAIDFYCRVLGAREEFRMPAPGGTIGHASLRFGEANLMLSDPFPGGYEPPKGRAPALGLYLLVEDVDDVVARAVEAGATVSEPVRDMFWGDRWGRLIDPWGHAWEVATHVEDVPPDQMAERAKAAMAQMG